MDAEDGFENGAGVQNPGAAGPAVPYAMSTVRSRLPRPLLWALAIGVPSFLLALLMPH